MRRRRAEALPTTQPRDPLIHQEIFMKTVIFTALAISAVAGSVSAQPPAPPKLATEAANYVSIPMQIDVKKPAAVVWKRIGKYCDIAEWLQIPAGCQIASREDGQGG